MKDLYICGCSHSTGFYWKSENPYVPGNNIPYSVLLAKKFSLNPVMLAHPGASNYFIVKQIEFAIEQGAEYIIFNTTQPLRFDWVTNGSSLISKPVYENFICARNANNNNAKIKSASYASIIGHMKDEVDLGKFITMYMDPEIKLDQDKWMFRGIISTLEKTNIRYLSVDCTDDKFFDFDFDIDGKSWQEIKINNYSITDKNHMSQKGHEVFSEFIYNKTKDTFMS